MGSSNPLESQSAAERLYFDFAAKRQRGEASPADFENLCREHSNLAPELRELYERDLRYRSLFATADENDVIEIEDDDPTPLVLKPGQEIADFRLERRLGKGGMGQVWEATQRSLQRRVALKFVRSDRISVQSLARFELEARAGGRADHPNLVRTFGRGESEGLAWIAQELVVGGKSLRIRLDELRREPVRPVDYYPQVALTIRDAALGMQAAHDAGVIHRDLKPENILLDRSGRPRIVDFGVARMTDEPGKTATGHVAGTLYYMSPEQTESKSAELDHRTDIFSLGVVMYELLTLQRPFEGETSHEILEKVRTHDPIDPRKLRGNCPRDLATICLKALEKRPAARYESMRAFADDLERYFRHEPILARPSTRVDLARKWVRRNPSVSVGIAVGVGAMLVISGLALYTLDLARQRKLDAERATRGEMLAKDSMEFAQRKEAEAQRNAAQALANQQQAESNARRAELLAEAEREAKAEALSQARAVETERRRTQEANDRLRAQAREQKVRGLIQDVERFRAQCRSADGLESLGMPAWRWWLEEASRLLDGQAEDHPSGTEWRPGLQDVQARLEELRSHSLPWSSEERARDRLVHPAQQRIRELEQERREKLDPAVLRAQLEQESSAARQRLQSLVAYGQVRLSGKSWPADVKVAAAHTALLKSKDRFRLDQQARRYVEPAGNRGNPEQLVLAKLLAKRAVDLCPPETGYEMRETYAWSLFWLGHTNEAISQMNAAITVAGGNRAVAQQSRQQLLQEALLWSSEQQSSRLAELETWRAQLAEGSSAPNIEARMSERQALVHEHYESILMPLRQESKERRTWRFADRQLEWWHAQLSALHAELLLLDDLRTTAIRSVATEEAQSLWAEAIEAIAESPLYAGQRWPSGERITPQIGLLPIGENPVTGLWEFVHLQSGDLPARGPDGAVARAKEGRLVLLPETGMVFVLLPGGRVPDSANTGFQEKWIAQVDLHPFFIAKYELTHEQWARLSVRRGIGYRKEIPLMPATSIAWDDIRAMWRREMGWCDFPSEAQWEYACRAGTTTQWWCGDAEAQLKGVANLGQGPVPIGSLLPNAFGLHDVHGNVEEWCGDTWGASAAARVGDGLRDDGLEAASERVLRGGSWYAAADFSRSAFRARYKPEGRLVYSGVRPVRSLTP